MRGRSGIEGKFFLDGSLVYRRLFLVEMVNIVHVESSGEVPGMPLTGRVAV